MKSKYYLYIVISLVLIPTICVGASSGAGNKESPLIQEFSFNDLPEPISGCSCLFHVAGSNEVLFASDLGKKVWMKVDGQLTKLTNKHSHSGGVGSHGGSLGSNVTFHYQAGRVEIVIETEKTSECPKGALECEGEGYKASFMATDGDKETKFDAVGGCGC